MSIIIYNIAFMKDEDLINFYEMGLTLAYENKNFPFWFEFGYEKIACLQGFNDYEIGIHREKEEILEEIKKLIK